MTLRGSTVQQLLDAPIRPGLVCWLGRRSFRRGPMLAETTLSLTTSDGVVGDHYAGASGTRQVSLIGQEDLDAIASYVGLAVLPELLRRNIVTRRINLRALKGRQFRLGTALLSYTGECHPCSRMEEALGPGGYNAVRGHGGILARVLENGTVRLGDVLERHD